MRATIVMFAVLWTGVARGAPRGHTLLEAARQAVDDVRYDDARRLLGDALAAGDNGPDDVVAIYALSARTAIVFDDHDTAQQLYRRWLELEPSARLPDGSSPKLRGELEAARAFIAARGSLMATASWHDDRVDVTIAADAMGIVHAAKLAGRDAVPLASERRVRLVGDGPSVELVDDYGNAVARIAITREVAAKHDRSASPSRRRLWITSSIVLGGVAAGLGIAAALEQHAADRTALDSGGHRKADADAAITRARGFGVVAGVSATLALGCVGIAITGAF